MAAQSKGQDGEHQYLHHGIAARTFCQTFNLAEHVKVTGAAPENGRLTAELKREVPEAPIPRRTTIGGAPAGVD